MAIKIAIPTWADRISPVFDVARRLLILDVEDGAEVARSEVTIEETAVAARAKRLADLGTNVLICEAISWPLEAMVSSAGIRVIPQTCGPVEEVLRAFLSGQLTEQAFLMPGCRGRWYRFRGGRGRGRMGGPRAAGPGGQCTCPKCGHKAPHVVGQPCNQKACPKCGTKMTRS